MQIKVKVSNIKSACVVVLKIATEACKQTLQDWEQDLKLDLPFWISSCVVDKITTGKPVTVNMDITDPAFPSTGITFGLLKTPVTQSGYGVAINVDSNIAKPSIIYLSLSVHVLRNDARPAIDLEGGK